MRHLRIGLALTCMVSLCVLGGQRLGNGAARRTDARLLVARLARARVGLSIESVRSSKLPSKYKNLAIASTTLHGPVRSFRILDTYAHYVGPITVEVVLVHDHVVVTEVVQVRDGEVWACSGSVPSAAGTRRHFPPTQ